MKMKNAANSNFEGKFSINEVFVIEGDIQFTVILNFPNSTANALEIPNKEYFPTT